MSISHTIAVNWTDGAATSANDVTVTGTSAERISEAIADSTTDGAVTYTCDMSALAGLFIVSDQALTLETNSSSSPQETITLVADTPVVWYTGCGYTKPYAGDVTSLFATNASGSTANLTIVTITDATP